MGLEAVLPGPQNALYVMLCYVMLLGHAACHTARLQRCCAVVCAVEQWPSNCAVCCAVVRSVFSDADNKSYSVHRHICI